MLAFMMRADRASTSAGAAIAQYTQRSRGKQERSDRWRCVNRRVGGGWERGVECSMTRTKSEALSSGFFSDLDIRAASNCNVPTRHVQPLIKSISKWYIVQ